jgi:hypothetical protein
MARVCVTGEHLVAKDLRAFVRRDADLHLADAAHATFTLEVKATLPRGSVVSVDTGPKVSATENAVIACLAQRLKRVLVQCGAGVRHEHYVVVDLPADLRDQESYDVAEALYMGLLRAGQVLPAASRWQRWLSRALLAMLLLTAAAPARAQIHQVTAAGGGGGSSYPTGSTVSGTIAALGDTITLTGLTNSATAIVTMDATTFDGTIYPEGRASSSDTWHVWQCYKPDTAGAFGFVNQFQPATAYIVSCPLAGLNEFRLHAAAWVSGSVSAILRASPASNTAFVQVMNPTAIITQTSIISGTGSRVRTGDWFGAAFTATSSDPTGAESAQVVRNIPSGTQAVNCVSGCGSPPATADNTAFTAGTTNVTPIAAIVDDTATTTITEDHYGAPRMTTSRVLYADLSKTGANTTAIKVDGSAVTQPVSGTVTANQGTATAVTTSWPMKHGAPSVASNTLDLTVLNAAVTITSLDGYTTVGARITAGAVVGSPIVTIEASFDGTNWNDVLWTQIDGTATTDGVTSTSANTMFVTSSFDEVIAVPLPPGATQMRFRVSTAGSTGSATIVTAPTASPYWPSVLINSPVSLSVLATQTGTWTVAQGTAAALSGAWPVKVTDGTNSLPTMDTVGRAGFQKVTDGTNTAAVKAASTAAAAADPSLVVAFSPNSALPTGSNTIGALTANQSVNVNQVAGAAAATAASGTLKVGITGNAGAALDAANNAAMPANAEAIGLQTATIDTSPTAATAGNLRYQLASTEGVAYVQEGGPKRFSCVVASTATVTTQCQAAPAAGLRAYVTGLVVTNAVGTAQSVDIVFGTGAACATGITALTNKFFFVGATQQGSLNQSMTFPTPLIPTAANAICARPTAATAFGVTITGYIAP